MTKQDKQQAQVLLDQISDFFWVYFDEKTSKMIKNHPGRAIPMLREAIIQERMSKVKICAYAGAMRKAVDYQGLLAVK